MRIFKDLILFMEKVRNSIVFLFFAATKSLKMAFRAVNRRRHVVTAFLLRKTKPIDESLLLQRSQDVSTYKLHWHAIYGFLEGQEVEKHQFLDRVLQEIWEETTLKPPSIQPIRPGRPLPIHDSDKHFIVHPFLFHLNTSKKPSVELNWEILSHKWLPAIPQTFSNLQTVPKLSETFGRIYFLGKEKESLDFLRDDRRHGAPLSWQKLF